MNPTESAVDNHNAILQTKVKLPASLSLTGWILLAAGIVLFAAAFFTDKVRASFDFQILLMFLTSVGLGSLFLVALEYAAGAVWSTPVRRVSEFLSASLFLVPVAIVVMILNMHNIFHWSHTEVYVHDKILANKSPYLNSTFFIIRAFFYIAVWLLFYFLITGNSRRQDKTKDQALTKRNNILSSIFIPVFAITITFAAVDWMMSLELHWFSTIYGVYYFSGTVLCALAAATLFILLMSTKGLYPIKLFRDHLYSMGALLFAFTNFWAYIAFSQYMLIWYGNLPEETSWMLVRWSGSWKYVSLGLIIIHFIIPYFTLLSQPAKMNPKRLRIMSVWILFAHLYDLYWLIMPTYNKNGAVFGWTELAIPVTLTGLIIVVFTLMARNNNIVPIGDPKLESGINFRL